MMDRGVVNGCSSQKGASSSSNQRCHGCIKRNLQSGSLGNPLQGKLGHGPTPRHQSGLRSCCISMIVIVQKSRIVAYYIVKMVSMQLSDWLTFIHAI